MPSENYQRRKHEREDAFGPRGILLSPTVGALSNMSCCPLYCSLCLCPRNEIPVMTALTEIAPKPVIPQFVTTHACLYSDLEKKYIGLLACMKRQVYEQGKTKRWNTLPFDYITNRMYVEYVEGDIPAFRVETRIECRSEKKYFASAIVISNDEAMYLCAARLKLTVSANGTIQERSYRVSPCKDSTASPSSVSVVEHPLSWEYIADHVNRKVQPVHDLDLLVYLITGITEGIKYHI